MNDSNDPFRTGPLQEDELAQFRRIMRFLVQNEPSLKTLVVVADHWDKWGWFKRLLFRGAVAITTVGSAWLLLKDTVMHWLTKGP